MCCDCSYLCEGSAILRRNMKAKKEQFEELQNAMDLVGFENDVCHDRLRHIFHFVISVYCPASRKLVHIPGSSA